MQGRLRASFAAQLYVPGYALRVQGVYVIGRGNTAVGITSEGDEGDDIASGSWAPIASSLGLGTLLLEMDAVRRHPSAAERRRGAAARHGPPHLATIFQRISVLIRAAFCLEVGTYCIRVSNVLQPARLNNRFPLVPAVRARI